MIDLLNGLPMLKFETGEIVEFRQEWLVRSIVHAAAKAGYPNWWLAEHVTESVTAYLRLRVDESVLAVSRLTGAVQSVLQAIGYAEVASYFDTEPPILQLYLPTVAREAGLGFELSFFHLLGQRLRDLCHHQPRHIELLGLQSCVKLVRARRIWSRDCSDLQDEIVAFVRQQITSASLHRDILFSLS